jgi:peptidoglycan hydrolase-like protein with peptidoglycan-binding domain
MHRSSASGSKIWRLTAISSFLLVAHAHAGMVTDPHGNVGYTSAAECDAAVNAGTAKFYQSFTHQPQLKRAGEVDVKVMKLGELPGFSKGACDVGVGHRNNRDGVSGQLIGKYVPFSPEMSVNAYLDAQGKVVRATMQQCDNNFSAQMPRPVGVPATSECFASVLTPAKFETRSEQVVKLPETKRFEPVPPTFKAVTEEIVVKPEIKRQIPVPATYKEVREQVLVRPESFREEPIPATYKMVSEQVMVSPESKRIEVIPGTFKTVSEKVMVSPERKELKVIPATYAEKEESVVDRPATTRVETVPGTFKTETERVLLKAESLRYEPIALPLRTVKEEVLRSEESSNLRASKDALKTESEQVLVKEASKRLVEVPAVFETVTERIKVADATKEWKRGKAWVGKALNVRPLRGFVVGKDGKVDGATVDTKGVYADNTSLDDDVMCLVEIPEQYQMISRQVLKTPASVREEVVPAQYATVKRQVMAKQAETREAAIPATYQTVTRQVIDIEKLKNQGYKFDENGDIVATPNGERVLRAATVAGLSNADKSAGAQSGTEGYVREIKVPAQYQTVSRQVVDQPPVVRTVEVPATYKKVKTRVVVTPATTQEVVIPAIYETATRQVVDQSPSTREVVIPAVYKTVERKVVDQAASTRKIPVPAVYETITRRVIDQPATLRETVIPAVTKTVTRQVIDQPASVREVVVPAQYETLNYQVKVAEGSTEQRAILCDTNATPAKIAEIQRALKKGGFDPGPIDGQLRAQTMKAVNLYQQSNKLPVDGYLNLETVKALGISPN